MPVLLFLCLLIVGLGQIAGRHEGWTRSDSLYWSFITGLTIGYGDIRPVTGPGRIFSIIIGLLGLMMSGIIVAIAVNAATRSFAIHVL